MQQALILICLPVPLGDFDELALPPVAIADLQRFGDARLAIAHGASCSAIRQLITHMESRSWDTAGFRHEFDIELVRLHWVMACWEKLQDAGAGYSEEYRLMWLRKLRQLIGPDAYESGTMPAFPVDALRFIPVVVTPAILH